MHSNKIISNAYHDIGKKKSIILCIEELAELNSAILSMVSSKKYENHLCEEIADVEIHIEYIKKMLRISSKQIRKSSKDQFDKKSMSYDGYSISFMPLLSKEKLYLTRVNEIAELITHLTKYLRGKPRSKKKIIKSIAAVEIYIDEILEREKIGRKKVKSWTKKKQKRLKHRVKKHKVF